MVGGRLSMAKLTGQRLTVEDLNKGIPSIETDKKCFLLLLDSTFIAFINSPSQTSLKTWSVLLEQYYENFLFLAITADKGFVSETCSKWPVVCPIQ